MSEETLKHAFEPLFTTKKGRDTGLGLAAAHQIVTAHAPMYHPIYPSSRYTALAAAGAFGGRG